MSLSLAAQLPQPVLRQFTTLLVKGYDYKIIAEKLFLSSHTVRKHIANIYAKLHVTSKAQAINLVHKKRWFEV
jgi:DNA-binding NarL/FixJ family response regulator